MTALPESLPDRFVLRSRRVLLPDGLRPAAVAVASGRIEAVAAYDAGGIDVDAVLSPGLVDTHVHINEPGRSEWEGFATATDAAAAGGVTTLVDMPLNSSPVTTTATALAAKVHAAHRQLRVDCGFWGGVVPGNRGDLEPLTTAGALGAKAFMCFSGIDDFPASDERTLREAMRELVRLGRPLLLHAEVELPGFEPPTDLAPDTYLAWLHARPNRFEDEAIALAVALVRETRCRTHIVHLSSASAIPMLAEARAASLPISAETCPHYLGLAAEDVPRGATEWKCAPPIRGRANQDGLWDGVRAGVLDVIVTDHSPCVPALKGRSDFLAAWGGIASLQLGFSSVWAEASRRDLALDAILNCMTAAPSRLAQLPRKGVIAPGHDADFALIDPDATFVVDPGMLRFRHPVSPWIGKQLRGAVRATILGGHLIWNGRHLVGPRRGRPLGVA